MSYASTTEVPVDRSKAEIEKLLMANDCDAIATIWDAREKRAAIQFRLGARMMRFALSMPSPDDEAFRYTPARRHTRRPAERRKAYEQAVRSKWRGLLLCIRAKLEAVESGIETIEEAFMAQILLPDGTTVGQRMLPAVAQAYETGDMPSVGLLTD